MTSSARLRRRIEASSSVQPPRRAARQFNISIHARATRMNTWVVSVAAARRRARAPARARGDGVHGARICVGYTRIRELLYPVALELSIPTKLSLYKSD